MSGKSNDVVVAHQNAARPPPIALGINVEKPKFPQYAVYAKRLESFETWPEYIPVTKEDLVEAGLVYTGVGDSVRCYYCGGGLRNWEREDVPMEEHAKWYPKCPHIMLVKGQNYVEKLSRGERPEEDGAQTQADSVKQASEASLESVPALACIEMGYSKDLIKKAINTCVQHGKSDYKAADLMEILMDIEDGKEDTAAGTDSTTDAVTVTASAKDEDQIDEIIEPLETLLEENQRLKESQTCKICLDKRAEIIFLPCGHMVSCPQCAPAMIKCPVCRKIINGHIKAFFAVAVP